MASRQQLSTGLPAIHTVAYMHKVHEPASMSTQPKQTVTIDMHVKARHTARITRLAFAGKDEKGCAASGARSPAA